MATIKLTSTKNAGGLMRYCEQKMEVANGVDCSPECARSQFKATRELYGKEGGVQAHHIIQSFRPNEVTPDRANEMGQALAKEMAKGHEVMVYTHADRKHIHNHIVINAVNHEDGRKYQSSRQKLHRIRECSDRLCTERTLSVVRERSADVRYTFAERSLLEKGKPSWKDEIRASIDQVRKNATGLEDFRERLEKEYGIQTKLSRTNITYQHPDNGLKVRGSTLGLAYEKETLSRELERKVEHRPERGGADRACKVACGDSRTKRLDAQLHPHSDGSRDGEQNHDRQGTKRDKGYERESANQDDFNFDEAKRNADDLRRNLARDYGSWAERNENEQSKDNREVERDRNLFARENASHRGPDRGDDRGR